MAEYRMESRTKSGLYLAPLPFRNLQGEFYMNKPKQIRFNIPMDDAAITYNTFYPRKTEVWIYRNDSLLFAGPLWNATASSKERSLSCDAQSIDAYLYTRRIDADIKYTGTFGSTAWSLVTATQALTDGNLYVTQGTLVAGGSPSGTVTYTKAEGKYIYDAIDDLAGGDLGFDWEITANRVLNQYYPRIQTNARTRLEYGANVSSYSLQVMGQYEANNIIVKGPDNTLSTTVVDTAKRNEYGLSHYVGSNTGLKSVTLLNAYADQILKLRRDARIIPQVSIRASTINPFDGDLSYGQLVTLVIDDGWAQFNQTMRVGGFQVTVGKHFEETFVLYLNDLREVEEV